MRYRTYLPPAFLLATLLGCLLPGGIETATNAAASPASAKLQREDRAQRNIRNIGKGIIAYAVTSGSLPVAGGPVEDRPGLSWRVAILPSIGEGDLYEQFHLDEPWDSEHNLTLIEQMPDIFLSPGQENESGQTHYQAVVGEDTCFHGGNGQSVRRIGANDGYSTTILLVEADEPVTWTAPEDWEFDAEAPFQNLGSLREEGTFLAVFADGSVRVLSTEMTGETLHALLTPEGNETVQADDIIILDE